MNWYRPGLWSEKMYTKFLILLRRTGSRFPAVNLHRHQHAQRRHGNRRLRWERRLSVQFSNSGAAFYAGKSLNNEGQRAGIAGGVAGAIHIHQMAECTERG